MASASSSTTAANSMQSTEAGRALARWERRGGNIFVEARVADDGTFAWSGRTKASGGLVGCAGYRSLAECVMRAAVEVALIPGRALARVI